MINEHAGIQQTFEPFENHFCPWSYLRMPLTNGKFGYLLCIGGDSKNGYFYECISLADDGMSSVNLLDNTPRLYRQIVQGYFNPLLFDFIGISSRKTPISEAYFRVLEDALSPDELALIYKKYGFSMSFEDRDWLPLLNEIAKAKGVELCTSSKYLYRISISDDGSAKWSDLEEWHTHDLSNPMPFGVIARYENLNDALTGGFDLLALTDHAYRVKPDE